MWHDRDWARDRNRALNVLLSLAEPDDAVQVRRLLRVEDPPAAARPEHLTAVLRIAASSVPTSARLWMLEADDPEINELVVLGGRLPPALELSVLTGEPFGPDGGRVLPRTRALRIRPLPEGVRRCAPGEAVPALRAARTMRQGRSAAKQLGRADWTAVIEADVQQPLPGFARWALALRPDCPRVLRERFADHPSFAHRMRTGGIVDGPAEYVREWGSARAVLTTLDVGRWAFPAYMPKAEDILRPLVRDVLGGSLEPWALLAQLLPTFTGTAPELIAASATTA